MKKTVKPPFVSRSPLSRRDALRSFGVTLAAVPLTQVLGCDLPVDLTDPPVGGEESGGAGAVTQPGTGGDSSATGWASGGTASIAAAAYQNPFQGAAEGSCTLTCRTTLGPCHDDLAPEREDISEGRPGLPMRLGFRVVDENCVPITDASVDVWHVDAAGLYSSETADSPSYCTGNDRAALAARFFRGHQPTDSDGIAWFNSCFPGWYRGRAVHIHLTVRRSGRAGDEYLTTQVAFDEELIQDVFSSHPDYIAHGQPDTSYATDNVFPSANVDDYLMNTQQMDDGVLLAWKTIVIRSSLSDAVCGGGFGFGL